MLPAQRCADELLRRFVRLLYVLCGSHRLRLEKERRLGHYGILRRRQQPDRFHAGRFILSALPQVLRGLQNYRYVIYAVLVLLILNFKPSGLLGEWELTPRNIQQLFAKLGKKNTAKKEG